MLDHAGSALIDGNVLHECNGASPGLYAPGAGGAPRSARASRQHHLGNAGGDALAFSPNAQVSVARRNLIVDNLSGIFFSGGPKVASRDNRIELNMITRNCRFDVQQRVRGERAGGNGQPRHEELHLEPGPFGLAAPASSWWRIAR